MNLHIIPTALLVASTSSVAMSLRDAGENLLYFEHARLASEYCERQKISVRPAHEAWLQSNSALYVETAGAIRMHAEQSGLSRSEQDALLKDAIGNQRALAREHIAKNGVNCQRFSASLQMYSSLLKR